MKLLDMEYRLSQLVWICLSNLGKFNLDFAKAKDEYVAFESFSGTLCRNIATDRLRLRNEFDRR